MHRRLWLALLAVLVVAIAVFTVRGVRDGDSPAQSGRAAPADEDPPCVASYAGLPCR